MPPSSPAGPEPDPAYTANPAYAADPGTQEWAASLAVELRLAETRAEPVELLTARFPKLDFTAARRIARARDELRRVDGDVPVGYKLGWTSEAMRGALGIDQPNWGTLWRSQLRFATIDTSKLIHPKLEPELVARVGANGKPVGWALGLEVVDPRFPSYDLDWLDNTADNSSAAAVVVGEFSPVTSPAAIEIEFGDETESRRGRGAAAMGDPMTAVDWLIESLASEGLGEHLTEGDIVFTGGICAPFDVVAGKTYTATAPELGSVSLAFR